MQRFRSPLFAGQWKKAIVTPIFKKGCKSDPSNYRPVSLTSVVCKVLERIISENILEHIKSNSLQCPQQHGFTTGRSTATNLLEAVNILSESLSHNVPVDVIFLDYAKAFDTVTHIRLGNQIETFGIRGNMLAWIKAFLTGKRQKVVVNSALSQWTPETSGVPQGSVLGPLLFTLFVSDIPSTVNNFWSLVADDTKIHAALYDEHSSCTTSLQEDLDRLQNWTVDMQMRFHPAKCRTMHLGKHNPNTKYTLPTDDETLHEISQTAEEKDLGFTIDDKLIFSRHIQIQVNKANSAV